MWSAGCLQGVWITPANMHWKKCTAKKKAAEAHDTGYEAAHNGRTQAKSTKIERIVESKLSI